MDSTETTSTSAYSAAVTPIVLRLTDQVRLVFIPKLVNNPANPRAGIDGEFIYQRKTKQDSWESVTITSLGTVKKGEAYKLDLHASELLTLVEGLGPLYRLIWAEGVPQGRRTYVRIEAGLVRLLELNEVEFAAFAEAHSDEAATTLNRLLQWLALSPKLPRVVAKLAALPTTEVPPLSALLGLSSLKSARAYWLANTLQADEEFWQRALSDRTFVLSQLFSYPVLLVKEKAYVGGKTLSNKGASLSDFLMKAANTDALLIVEIKSPATPLLGKEYRVNVFPPSSELSGALSQVLHYRQNLQKNFYSLRVESGQQVTLGEPRAIILVGHTDQLDSPGKRESFELLRHRLAGVTIVTFDELFDRLAESIALVESAIEA